ncbi:MAG: aminopeptidase, partial [Phocaeicola sp.]
MNNPHFQSIYATLATLLLALVVTSCTPSANSPSKLTNSGVSHELASYRKAHYKDVTYQLYFSIPQEIEQPVTGEVKIALQLSEKKSIVVDFRGEASQIASLSLNGKEVPYEVKNEHIIIEEKEATKGGNQLNITFTANNQSLNRREEFLYTLLVPDRARTLFPCFEQPNIKAHFSLTLEVPSQWEAVANSPIEQMDSTSVTGRKVIHFAPTEPLSTYLFSFVAGELMHQTYQRGEREIALYYRETDPKKVAQCPQIASEVF